MRTEIFAIGAVIMIIGLALVLYDQPRSDAILSFAGIYAFASPDYQNLLREIFIGQMLIVIGIVILIPGIILKKKEAESKEDIQYKSQPERNLRNSPILQGVLIGVIAIVIFWGIFGLVFYQTFNMANDALSPDVMKGDLMHYQRIPFNEIKVGDIIAFIPSDKDEFGTKVGIVRGIVPGSYVQTSSNANPNTLSQVYEKDYVGKITSVTSQGGIITVYSAPYHLVITAVLFVIPIVIMKIREKNPENS